MSFRPVCHEIAVPLVVWTLRVAVAKARREKESIASNDTAQGRSQNRRVEIEVTQPQRWPKMPVKSLILFAALSGLLALGNSDVAAAAPASLSVLVKANDVDRARTKAVMGDMAGMPVTTRLAAMTQDGVVLGRAGTPSFPTPRGRITGAVSIKELGASLITRERNAP